MAVNRQRIGDREQATDGETAPCSLFPVAFSESIEKFGIKGKLACACSGGVDSLAMTVLAAARFDVVALIVDHGLRAESKNEAAKTSKILDGLGIKNVILRNHKKIISNLQEKAREVRYKLLTDYCRLNSINYLATAHHADDNAETFLLRLSRGSGVDGLSGIAAEVEMNGVKIIRPVLQFTKLELQDFLMANKIKWVADPTNDKDVYKRNKLRQSLAELEDKELITKRINDAAINLARVREFLEIEAEKAYQKVVEFPSNLSATNSAPTPWGVWVGARSQVVKVSVDKFKILHDEIAYRVLVKVIMELSETKKKPRFNKLKRLKDDLLNGKTRTLNGLIFRPNNSEIIISREAGAEPSHQPAKQRSIEGSGDPHGE